MFDERSSAAGIAAEKLVAAPVEVVEVVGIAVAAVAAVVAAAEEVEDSSVPVERLAEAEAGSIGHGWPVQEDSRMEEGQNVAELLVFLSVKLETLQSNFILW